MRCFKLSPLLLLCLSAPGLAECIVCDEIVEINSARAECFMKNHSAIAAAIVGAPNGRAPIDLDSCEVNGEKMSMRGGISDLPTPLGVPSQPLSAIGPVPQKSVYLLDKALVDCLKSLIEQHPASLDPVARFDLFEQCQF